MPPKKDYLIRTATDEDLPSIISLLHADTLGKQREAIDQNSETRYHLAWQAIKENNACNVFVLVVEHMVIGCYQMMILPHLSHQGTCRAQIESVRVHPKHRGKGFGHVLMQHAIETAKNAGCGLLQLTSDQSRERAHTFYQTIGFQASHRGYKKHLID